MSMRLHHFSGLVILILVGAAFALWSAIAILKPGPAGKLIIASGGAEGDYQRLALAYQKELAPFGVDVELRPQVQGRDTLKALFVDPNSDIQAGVIKGGVAASLEGRFATDQERTWHDRQVKALKSVGRLFYEPIWIFTRNTETFASLNELKGKKILVGTKEAGARRVAIYMLRANGVDSSNSTLIDEDLSADGGALSSDRADAAFLILPADATTVQRLIRNPALQLFDFASEAAAYAERIPALSARVLKKGSVEFAPDIPPKDITLLGTTPALVVRNDVHPAIAELLAYAVIHNPKSGFDEKGEPILFYQAGEFPNDKDPEFAIDPRVEALYNTGQLPFALNTLAALNHRFGIPFWVTAFAYDHGTNVLLLAIPLLSIVVPLARFLPQLYAWTVRRRLIYWYRQLHTLELSLDHNLTSDQLADKRNELDRIDGAVTRSHIPLTFSDELYDLRGHIDLIAQRLDRRTQGKPLAITR